MKKLINDPGQYVEDLLTGLVSAYPSLRLGGESGRCVSRAEPAPSGRVGIATGGGSGHLPLFTGYVGSGFTDACAIGNVFEGPTAQSCMDAIRAADNGAGVLCLYGNYGGDRMNFDTAIEMLELDGIECTTVLGSDDVASASIAEAAKRRGVAGIVLVYKVAGAAALRGLDLAAVTAAAQKANAATRTIGVALSPCQIPTAQSSNFELGDNEMEFGMGIHGEPGIWRSEMKTAKAVADDMLDCLMPELDVNAGDKLQVLVNGLGATPLEELVILWNSIGERLRASNIAYRQPLIGNYVTSMEMAGASVTIMKLDDELESLLTAPAQCPFWSVA